ncbi:hypothetical protein [Nocardiopsis suaedae]|uniref:Uncharacterized protein n=1 Tax=Nocardiopsis suaedae TaxID=3018444 RepID=A0ABT4TVU6_9ACTN|nr:hypothetical protein [Nocardiopsis suaedae]MDA2808815.1 hypothetical protein [Nocardiopsis suaedae]
MRSHRFAGRQPVSILSSRAGPHSSRALCTALEAATHAFHTHRHRPHSLSRERRAVLDTRRR